MIDPLYGGLRHATPLKPSAVRLEADGTIVVTE